MTNADDLVTLDSLDSVLAGAIDLEAKKEDFKRKLVEIIAKTVDSLRVSLHSLHEIVLNAYREVCESPLASRPPPSSPFSPEEPSNSKDV